MCSDRPLFRRVVCTIPIHSFFDPSAVTAENNVFDKPSAEGKSRSVCIMPRRENVCCKETNEKYKIEIFQPTKTHIIMKKVIGEFYKLNS